MEISEPPGRRAIISLLRRGMVRYNRDMRKHIVVALAFSLLAFECGNSTFSPAAGSTNKRALFYMSPLGNDSANATAADPVRTLNRIQEIVSAESPGRDITIRIISNLGVYYDQTCTWTFINGDHRINFEAYPDSAYATFQLAAASDSPLFTLQASSNAHTHLHFKRLYILRYTAGAIAFIGDRLNLGDGWNGKNVIENCVFDSIGNLSNPSALLAYGVLDFVNTRLDTVRHCTFIDCANAPGELAPNGVYLAHHSSENVIEGNTFLRFTGNCVRFRDASNDNRVYGNYFQESGAWLALITSWYCFDLVRGCPIFECPVQGNLVYDNTTCNCLRFYLDIMPRYPAFPPPVPCVDTRERVTVSGTIEDCPPSSRR